MDKPIQEVTPEQVRAFQLHLIEVRKVGWSSFNQAVCGLRILYRVTIIKPWPVAMIPFGKRRKNDLVITYSDLPGTGTLTAVVLKPRPRGGVYDIPEPHVGADVFHFLGDHLEEAAKTGVGLV